MLHKAIAVGSNTRRVKTSVQLNKVNERTTQFRINQTFTNYLPFDVVVIDSNNDHTLIRKLTPDFNKSEIFTIHRHYSWNPDRVEFNIPGIEYDKDNDAFYECDEYSNDYFDCLYKMITVADKQAKHTEFAEGGIDVLVNESLLTKHNGAIFIKELGIVIATVEVEKDVIHPHSTEAQLNNLDKDHEKGFIFQIYANDPTGTMFNTRYVNLNGQVYKIPLVKDEQNPPGVYITRGESPVGVGHTRHSKLLDRYDFDVADKALNLYRTPEDAKDHFGLLTAQKEKGLKELDYKLKEQAIANKARLEQMQVDFAKEKNDIEIEHKRQINEYKTLLEEAKAQADLRTAKLKKQADEFEERSMARKDTYESASYSRKDWSEYVKWIPGVVVGVAAAVAACFAIFL